MDKFDTECNRQRRRRKSDVGVIEKRAIEYIYDNLVVLESDKDGCWVVTDKEGFKHLEQEVVSNQAHYSHVSDLDIQPSRIRDEYAHCANVLSKFSWQKGLKRFLLSRETEILRRDSHKARLRMKGKTHKLPGQVKARAIHDGSNNPLGPGAALCQPLWSSGQRILITSLRIAETLSGRWNQ